MKTFFRIFFDIFGVLTILSLLVLPSMFHNNNIKIFLYSVLFLIILWALGCFNLFQLLIVMMITKKR